MAKYSKQELRATGLDGTLPKHVAIIMDGNGRWAKKRSLPRTLGHRAGMERLKGIIRTSSDIGIFALSMYAFSTENWKRPNEEVSALMELLIEYFKKEIDELHENGVRIRALGDCTPFPRAVREAIRQAEERTAKNEGLRLNIALNYGSKNELVRAAQSLAQDVAQGKLAPDAIDEAMLEEQMYTAGLPPVDFLIRTGGEQRLSNFLLYQAAYAEFLFLDDFWPDFSDETYIDALRVFLKRTRRYGGL